ncbi:hypothetical protein L1987_87284 [Smallanthus sonchifolius]|nr:hypothetical protein L1987_87284 [Smallanthus sonchifolius]
MDEEYPTTTPLLGHRPQWWRQIPSNAISSLRLHKTTFWSELGGSVGDLGTYIPIVLALTLVSKLDLGTTLIFTALYNIVTGLLFGIPMPVQPMKSIASVAISESPLLTLSQIAAAGIGTASVLLFLGATGLMSLLYRFIPLPKVKCDCAREFVRLSRHSEPDNLFDSAIAGFGTGSILGRLQGGPAGAIRYSIGIAIVGTGVDFAAIKLRPVFKNMYESVVAGDEKNKSRFKWPEWLPIQVLDEEALAAKRAREEALRARIRDLTKEES